MDRRRRERECNCVSEMEQIFTLFTIFLAFAFSVTCSNVISRNDFPEGFVFGSATSAYQWEGAVAEDGRTPSVWDTFSHSHYKDTADITCDGYHKYKEDVKLMVDTGLDAFRFSISWSRLIPNGRGPVNQKGLQFYKNLIQELVNHGIEPHVTLYHFDHPQYLEDEYGGWLNHRMIKDFTAYADVCFREFGNHVKFWTLINEANIYSIGGYTNGLTPPGHCSYPGRNCSSGNSSIETYIVGHNILLAHASASRLYKQKYKDMQGGFIGFSLYFLGFTPLTSSEDDYIATQRANDFYTGWMLGPLIFGEYPDTMKRTVGSRLPVFSEEEAEQVKGSADFIGVIHTIMGLISQTSNPNLFQETLISTQTWEYLCIVGIKFNLLNKKTNSLLFLLNMLILLIISSSFYCMGETVNLTAEQVRVLMDMDTKFRCKTPNSPYDKKSILQLTNLSLLFCFCLDKYPVAPWTMEVVLEYLKQSYGNPPVYILENGEPGKQLKQKDTTRVEYVHAYIGAVLNSIRNGSDTRAYFLWSFMDLFELFGGYENGFGLYSVNFSDPHRKRSPKLSAHWYSNFLKGGSQGIGDLQSNFSSSS